VRPPGELGVWTFGARAVPVGQGGPWTGSEHLAWAALGVDKQEVRAQGVGQREKAIKPSPPPRSIDNRCDYRRQGAAAGLVV